MALKLISDVPVVEVAGYVLAAVILISGFNSLKKHSENPNDPAHTIKSSVIRIGVGAGLITVVSMLYGGLRTIFTA